MSEPVGYLIRRPLDSDKGASLLFITRPSAGMFGGSAGTAIFLVDEVVSDPKAGVRYAKSAQGDFQFSYDMPYLLIPRALGRPVSTIDMAKHQLQEQKDWESVMKETEADLSAVAPTADGRTSHNPTGYL